MLPWPNVSSKWTDGLGPVHYQYETFAKLRISCPCEVELQGVLFFFEGDWYVHKIAVSECFDIGTWTCRISPHVLARLSIKWIGHRIFLLLSSVRVKRFANVTGCLFVRQENERRVFSLSPVGWIVSIGCAEEELHSFKFCAKNGPHLVCTNYPLYMHLSVLWLFGFREILRRRSDPSEGQCFLGQHAVFLAEKWKDKNENS